MTTNIDIYLGHLAINPRGAYNPALDYMPRDLVNHGTATWVCKKKCKGITPTDGVYWMKSAEDGKNSQSFTKQINVSDWLSYQDDKYYYIDVTHSLNSLTPDVTVYNNDNLPKEISVHSILIVNANTVKILIGNSFSDDRFQGKVTIKK